MPTCRGTRDNSRVLRVRFVRQNPSPTILGLPSAADLAASERLLLRIGVIRRSAATRVFPYTRKLHLIKMWLESPVEETDDRGRKTRTTAARDNRCGIPQGSPISPLLANLYMRRFVLGWKMLGLEQSLGSRIVTYADDLVILCRQGKPNRPCCTCANSWAAQGPGRHRRLPHELTALPSLEQSAARELKLMTFNAPFPEVLQFLYIRARGHERAEQPRRDP
jgi:Reverse transcriptase (RNA-dependent DNA polymerase)